MVTNNNEHINKDEQGEDLSTGTKDSTITLSKEELENLMDKKVQQVIKENKIKEQLELEKSKQEKLQKEAKEKREKEIKSQEDELKKLREENETLRKNRGAKILDNIGDVPLDERVKRDVEKEDEKIDNKVVNLDILFDKDFLVKDKTLLSKLTLMATHNNFLNKAFNVQDGNTMDDNIVLDKEVSSPITGETSTVPIAYKTGSDEFMKRAFHIKMKSRADNLHKVINSNTIDNHKKETRDLLVQNMQEKGYDYTSNVDVMKYLLMEVNKNQK